MGFIEMFFKKNPTAMVADDVESFISRKIEENQNLDYKDIEKYQDSDDLSKHISAFANSSGGLLILGVSEEKVGEGRIYPKEITWGDETLSKETLENRLAHRIQPTLTELKIVPIRESKESHRVIFLVDTPKSNNAPHMASDNKYYRRMNFSRKPMEHYEVANLFRANWLTREKLIEKILAPMTSILEKQASQFEKYGFVHTPQLEEILLNTYYRLQISEELLEKIDHYIRVTDKYGDGLSYARRTVPRIYTKIIMEFLEEEQQDFKGEMNIGLQSISDEGTTGRPREDIVNLLLRNESLETYLNKYVYDDSARVHTMEIKYPLREENKSIVKVSYKTEKVDLSKFIQLIWKRCLTEIADDERIVQMKKNAELLKKEAWGLIEDIRNY